MGPGDPGGEDQGRELTAESWSLPRCRPDTAERSAPASFPAARRGRDVEYARFSSNLAARRSVAAPREAEGEARWTGLPGLTINRPLPGPRAHGSAQVAQLVEHATENRSVGGSIPPLGTISLRDQRA